MTEKQVAQDQQDRKDIAGTDRRGSEESRKIQRRDRQ